MHLKTPPFLCNISGVHESPDRPCFWGSFVSQQGALWQYLYQQTPRVQWLFVINHLISGNNATKHMSTMKTTGLCTYLKTTVRKKKSFSLHFNHLFWKCWFLYAFRFDKSNIHWFYIGAIYNIWNMFNLKQLHAEAIFTTAVSGM